MLLRFDLLSIVIFGLPLTTSTWICILSELPVTQISSPIPVVLGLGPDRAALLSEEALEGISNRAPFDALGDLPSASSHIAANLDVNAQHRPWGDGPTGLDGL